MPGLYGKEKSGVSVVINSNTHRVCCAVLVVLLSLQVLVSDYKYDNLYARFLLSGEVLRWHCRYHYSALRGPRQTVLKVTWA